MKEYWIESKRTLKKHIRWGKDPCSVLGSFGASICTVTDGKEDINNEKEVANSLNEYELEV